MKRPSIIIQVVVVFLAATLPYVLAALLGGRDYVFIGFLMNPFDGASYLAKMYQGWTGSWQFTLPYTAETGDGAYLLLFYLFLGHIARWFGLPLIVVFHLARLVSAGLLLLALIQFYDRVFAERPDLYRVAFWLTAVGSGMGWLVVFFGVLPSDFWVAEAYPFLAIYTNPHFPLGLALILWSFTLLMSRIDKYRVYKLMVLGLLISIVMPFGVVVGLLVGGANLLWRVIESRRFSTEDFIPFIGLGLLGGPYLLYQFWVVQVNPLLSGWNAQNVTPSPPVWDVLLSFSPVLFLAFYGVSKIYRSHLTEANRILILWLVLGLLLLCVPFALQRRFMLGLYIPAAALAVFGIDALRRAHPRQTGWMVRSVFYLALPTNLLLLLIGISGAVSHSPLLYVTRDEASGLEWIRANTETGAVVLAAPEMGRLIPALTGRRVIYGHPFETVNAENEEEKVRAFYAKEDWQGPGMSLLEERDVRYIFWGPQEQALSGPRERIDMPLVFEAGAVRIYEVQKAP
jgi:hypothetical protein